MPSFSYRAFDDESLDENAFSLSTGGPPAPSFSRAAFSVAAFSEQAFFFDDAPPGPPPATTVTGPLPSGGIPATLRVRRRTRKELLEDRERFGISQPIAEVIADIAAQQAERLESDEQKRFEELSRELQIRRIEWDGRYLDALNVQRQKLIDTEIGLRLNALLDAKRNRKQLQNEQAIIALMLMAASI